MRKVDYGANYDQDLNTWIRKDRENYTLGLTDWSQGYFQKINTIHFNCQKGDSYEAGYSLLEIESDKVTTDIHLPIDIKVLGFNELIIRDSAVVNKDCYGKGWLMEIEVINSKQLSEYKDGQWYAEAINSFFRKDV